MLVHRVAKHTDLVLKQVVCAVITRSEMTEPIRVWVRYTERWKMPYCTENFDEETSERKGVLETWALIRWGYLINHREISYGDVDNVVPLVILWT
jgi:hypothetical protein